MGILYFKWDEMYKLFLTICFICTNTLHASETPTPSEKSIESLMILPHKDGLSFTWSEKTPCALFEMMGRWFLVFAHAPSHQNLPKSRYLPRGIYKISAITNKMDNLHSAVYELEVLESYIPLVYKAQSGQWILTSAKKNSLKAREVTIQGFYEEWPSVSFSKIGLNKNIFFEDPLTGAHILAVMTDRDDNGFQGELSTPFFETLFSTQGIGLILKSDDLSSQRKDDILKISAHIPFTPLKSRLQKWTTQGLAAENIYKKGPEWNAKTQREGMRLQKTEGDKAPYSMLQKTWIALGLSDDIAALSDLEFVEKSAKGYAFSPIFRLLKGISLVLKGDYEDAIDILFYLPQTPEVRLWKFVALSLQDDASGYLKTLRRSDEVLSTYPDYLKNEVIEKILMVMLDADDPLSVTVLFRNVQYLKRKFPSGTYDYVAAITRMQDKEKDQGFEMLRALTSSRKITKLSPVVRSKALYSLAKYEFQERKIKQSEYEKKLGKIVPLWRYGAHGYRVIVEYADQLRQSKQHKKSLSELARVQSLFPKRFRAFHVDYIMEQTLVDFFDQDLSKISPIRVIGVYEEFKEFSPDGKMEERIIDIIIEKLINLDLLDQAAELLNKSIASQKETSKKNKLIFQAAQVHINNKHPESSLAILNHVSEKLTPLEEEEYHWHRAISHKLLGQNTEAFRELELSKTPRNLALLADLYLGEKNWEKANTILMRVIGLLVKPEDRKLKEQVILKTAMAQYLNNDFEENIKLAILFENIMKETPHWPLFSLVTRGHNLIPTQRKEVEELLESITLIRNGINYLRALYQEGAQ